MTPYLEMYGVKYFDDFLFDGMKGVGWGRVAFEPHGDPGATPASTDARRAHARGRAVKLGLIEDRGVEPWDRLK
jgi:hypothetical protein